MKQPRRRPSSPRITRVQVLQVSGISLLTVSVLNSVFLKTVGFFINTGLVLSGFFQLWLSFQIWQRRNRLVRSRKLLTIRNF
jgi:hypothetical protein